MKAVIVAAGTGSRLAGNTEQAPKTLLPFGPGTLLSGILDNLASVGVKEFIVVVGFKGDQIRSYCAGAGLGHRIAFVENPEWQRGNGLSVAAAKDVVDGAPFLLSMSDHLVPGPGLRSLLDAKGSGNLLLVDPRADAVFDIPDATKVLMDGARIARIGKELTTYNAVDCGVFRLDHRFFDAMAAAVREGKESITDGARRLIEVGAFEGVRLPDGIHWIDVDTPEAYEYALAHQERYLAFHPTSLQRRLAREERGS